MRLYLRQKWLGAIFIEFSTVYCNSLLFSLNKSGMEWVCEFPFVTCILTSARALRAERNMTLYARPDNASAQRNAAETAEGSVAFSCD